MEHRITITLKGHQAIGGVDALIQGFLSTHPEAGPVVDADLQNETVAITFALSAAEAEAALHAAKDVFVDGVTASGLTAGKVLRIEIEPANTEAVSEKAVELIFA